MKQFILGLTLGLLISGTVTIAGNVWDSGPRDPFTGVSREYQRQQLHRQQNRLLNEQNNILRQRNYRQPC